jgi:hypothetical protein
MEHFLHVGDIWVDSNTKTEFGKAFVKMLSDIIFEGFPNWNRYTIKSMKFKNEGNNIEVVAHTTLQEIEIASFSTVSVKDITNKFLNQKR